MEDYVTPFTVGHHSSKRPLPVTATQVSQAHATGYNLVTCPITTPHFHSRVLTLLSAFLSDASSHGNIDITGSYNASPVHITPLTPEDTPLTPDEFTNQIVGITSPWIDLSSPDPVIADISRQVLRLELQYAAFCGITYVVITGPSIQNLGKHREGIGQFARAVLDALGQGPYMQLYIWFPMFFQPGSDSCDQMGDLAPFARAPYVEDADNNDHLDLFGSWEAWDYIRSLCRYSTRLSVALSIPRLLPPISLQSRWYSEPVRLMTLDSTTFTKNPKGYPVLSKAHQALISRFAHFKQPSVWFLLCDVGPIVDQMVGNVDVQSPTAFPTLADSTASPSLKDPAPHLSYMRNLQTRQPARSAADRFGAGYQDYLQAPLQPLTVNLESITYEVFEKDPIKYEWYERAVARALHDWIEQGKPTSNPDGRVVVAVVGAGRGPLVTRALIASQAVGVDIDMWALEKNQNAFVLLQRHNQNVWENQVTLVKSDMRTWRGPSRTVDLNHVRRTYNLDTEDDEQASKQDAATLTDSSPHQPNQLVHYKIDILISELLGSFADNELSPECLDGVQHLMNPVHGISIPASYSAHVTPIAAPKLHADISLSMTSTMPNAAEIPYVVMLNAIDYLSTTDGLSARTETSTKNSDKSEKSTAAGPAPRHQRQQSYSAAVKQPQTPSAVEPDHSSSSQQPEGLNPIVQQTWAFHHRNPFLSPITTTSATATAAPSNAHNARYSRMTFPIPNRGTCHGLAGYFESVLYPGVELSTNPLTMDAKSQDMISWFPIYFPLKQPIFLPDNSELQLSMWRRTDDRKVWYEWLVDVYTYIEVNGGGGGGGGSKHDKEYNNMNNETKATVSSKSPFKNLKRPQNQNQNQNQNKNEAEKYNSTNQESNQNTKQIGSAAGFGAGLGSGSDDNTGMGKVLLRPRLRVRVGGSDLHSSEKEACLM